MRGALGHIKGSAPALGLMALVVVATGGVLIWVGNTEKSFGNLRAAVALPLLLILGLGSLLLLITIMVAVLHAFQLTDRRRAFGLPDGSMQAVIALGLVLIFVIASLYLYSSLPTKVAEDELEAAQDRRELAQQLLTTVGTLAVAVAGFYFGTRSVEAAASAMEGGGSDDLRITWPSSPVALTAGAGQSLYPILVNAPAGTQITSTIESGDAGGTLEQVSPGEFRYTRGPNAGPSVFLSFALPDGKTQSLEVREP